ncbi:DUF3077 domain-containing protein [Alcaligenaceae bacterium]|nr:DUF3077 domain-containing protein [Alcaligenaceae bacterium]
MNVSKTHEVSFLTWDTHGHLFAVRPGMPSSTALDCTASLLDTAHGLMLTAEETDCSAARAAATWLIEMAGAALEAGRGLPSK